MIYDNCPYCEAPLVIYNKRWNGQCKCPACENMIEVDFDFCYSMDDPTEEEFDIITLKKKEEQNFGEHEFECELYTEEPDTTYFSDRM